MLERVLTGGQSGADGAAWRAARAVGLATGGRMPAGFGTEDGPRPDVAHEFGAVEATTPGNPERTRLNVRAADAVLVLVPLARPLSRGSAPTLEEAHRMGRAAPVVAREVAPPAAHVAGWSRAHEVETLDGAGGRESTSPGFGKWVEAHLIGVFRLVQGAPGHAGHRRREGQTIPIADDITVTVMGIENDRVRPGLQCPRDIPVHRQGVIEAIERDGSSRKPPSPHDPPPAA